MSTLVWDEVGDRTFQQGVDRGVLYLRDGQAIPWNGLTSINEKSNSKSTKVYYDGKLINNLVTPGDYEAVMKAITYPDEFVELEGVAPAAPGMYLGDQMPKIFDLCYRTKVGTDIDADAGYKIHILYNVFAEAKDRTYATMGKTPTPMEFEWDISAISEEVTGYAPTAHVIIDSRKVDPDVLAVIEDTLYGSEMTAAALLPMADVVELIGDHYRFRITDNGDGTFTVYSPNPAWIEITGDEFELELANASVVGDTYVLSDTYIAGYEP